MQQQEMIIVQNPRYVVSARARHENGLLWFLRPHVLAALLVLVSLGPTAGDRSAACSSQMSTCILGETLAEAAGHQVLYKFVPGDKNKPMIVFVPGDAHLGPHILRLSGRARRGLCRALGQRSGTPFPGCLLPAGEPCIHWIGAGLHD